MDDHRALADALAADIEEGRLRPGDRLPTQRRFARDRGVAVSTAARAYAVLVQRGLVTGEVGRGTFVRAAPPPPVAALAEPAAPGRVDLELNFPVLPEHAGVLAAALDGLLRPDSLAAGLVPTTAVGTPRARSAAAAVLARDGWTPDPESVLFAGNGRQGLAASFAAHVPVGGRLGVEALTYPVVRAVAVRLGIELVPLAMDADGLLPGAVRSAGRLDAVYLQPTLHNPLGTTMPQRRRAELATALRELDLPAIEDTIYAFLRDGPAPFVVHAPERTTLVDSLSKRVAPGLTLGFVVPPPARRDAVVAALRSGGWTPQAFALEASVRLMAGGVVARLEADKRVAAAERQALVAQRLAGFTIRADPAAYHCWWELPAPWRAETFVAAAARRGIAVTPAAAFAVGPAHAPNAVRLALAPPVPVLAAALDELAALARGSSGHEGTE